MRANSPAVRAKARRVSVALALCIPVLAACVAFAPSLRNGFVWDDRLLIVENPALSAPGAALKAFGQDYWSGIRGSTTGDYYRPLAFASLAADHALYGGSPRGYHATNLILHASVVLLLALWLLDLGAAPLQAGLGAALFAAHPALAENVAWISGRTDILAALFVLVLLLADRRRLHAGWRALAFFACAAALFAKETAAIAPLLAVVARTPAEREWWPAVRRRAELWGLLGVYFVLRHHALGTASGGDPILGSGLSAATRLAGLLHLPGILLVPRTARLLYGAGLRPADLAAGATAGAALLAGLVIVVRRTGGWSRPGLVPVLVRLGFLGLLPAVAAAVLLSGLADRLVYLPAVFLLPAAALGILQVLPARAAAVVLTLAVNTGAAGAAARARLWRDDLTFFARAAAEPAAAAPAHYNLAIALHDAGRLHECNAALDQALAKSRLPGALFLRGLLYYEIGCDDLALDSYGEALQRARGYADAGANLAALHLDRGEFDAAERVYRDLAQNAQPPARRSEFTAGLQIVQRARAQPGFEHRVGQTCGSAAAAGSRLRDAAALNRRGLELLRWRRLEPARVALTAAVQLDPGLAEAQLNLAQYHMLSGTPDRARALLLELQRRDPSDPRPARLLEEIARRAARP